MNEITILKEALRNGFIASLRDAGIGAFDVLMILFAFSDDDKKAAISYKTICKATKFSLAKVVTTLERLEDLELIEKVRTNVRNRPSIYKINIKSS